MSFTLSWEERALQDLENLDLFLRKRIVKKIEQFIESESFHQIKKMMGYEKLYRLRVGDYRVIFELDSENVTILKIGHRKNIYPLNSRIASAKSPLTDSKTSLA
jgi:mRNA interferase RelE/StbE